MGETKKEFRSRLKSIEAKLDEILAKMHADQMPGQEFGKIDLAVEVTGLAKPTIYSMVSGRRIPHYKMGKNLYFKRKDLEDWITSGKRKTIKELSVNIR